MYILEMADRMFNLEHMADTLVELGRRLTFPRPLALEASDTPGASRRQPPGPPAALSSAEIDPARIIELVLIGGAAGMLSGLLDPSRTTIDVDVITFAPHDAAAEVLHAARQIARERGLPENWLNNAAQFAGDTLPEGWMGRRVLIAKHGRLHLYSVSRFDLIAMKLVAGRPQDVEDLQTLGVTALEAARLQHHFDTWRHDHWPASALREARALLRTLQPNADAHDDEHNEKTVNHDDHSEHAA